MSIIKIMHIFFINSKYTRIVLLKNYWIKFEIFANIQHTLSYILSSFILEKSNFSLSIFILFSQSTKKRKRKTNKMPPILLIFSSLFWKTGRYLEKSKRRKFACVLSRYLDGRYDYQTDARSGTFVSSFLVSLDIFDLLKRRIERRISNGREQCI